MPDIPDRQKREETLSTLLRRAIGRNHQRLVDALGSPPDVANVPDSLWQSVADEIENDTRNAIALLFLLGMRRMSLGGSVGGSGRPGQSPNWRPAPNSAGEQAASYAERRAAELGQGMSSTLRDRLDTAAREARARIDAGESEAAVRRDLNRRAIDIANEQGEAGGVTETTAANSAGEIAWRDEFEADTGIELAATWRTERDSRVCPICSPLDGADEEEWAEHFPDGPPGHVNCRCWLEFEEAEIESELEV